MRFRLALNIMAALAVGSALAPGRARADEPKKDAAISGLRARFSAARAPTADDLNIGGAWNCEYRSAEPGSHEYDDFKNYYRFEPNGVGAMRSVGDALSESYVFTDTALVGEKKWGDRITGIEHVRVERDGGLVVEFALPECSGLACLYFIVRTPSIDDAWSPVVGYFECSEAAANM